MNKMKFGSSKLAIDNDLLNAFSNSKTVGNENIKSIDEINAKDLAEELLERANHSITSTERERSALSKITKALAQPQIVEVDVSLLDSYKDHTFNVENDDSVRMQIFLRSIKEQGIIQPSIITPSDNGRYQVLAGHRRTRAAKILNFEKAPCIIRQFLDDEESNDKKNDLMIDSNIQRDGIKPSEKARAYKMKLDCLKKQGRRSDLIEHGDDEAALSDLDKKSKGSTYVQIALQEGDSRSEIYRYLRLNYLIKELLDIVDDEIIPVRNAAEISFLSDEYQHELYKVIGETGMKPTHAQAEEIKKRFQRGDLQPGDIIRILEKPKSKKSEKFYISSESVMNYIPKGLSTKEISLYIEKALQFYLIHGTDREI